MKLGIERARCGGGGVCKLDAPTVFGQAAEDGMVVLLKDQPDSCEMENVRIAVALCPTGAIGIVED
jgi:ferredoxin